MITQRLISNSSSYSTHEYAQATPPAQRQRTGEGNVKPKSLEKEMETIDAEMESALELDKGGDDPASILSRNRNTYSDLWGYIVISQVTFVEGGGSLSGGKAPASAKIEEVQFK